MDNSNQSAIVTWLIILLIVAFIGVISTGSTNNNLIKQVTELQAQKVALENCVNYYSSAEDKFINAIESAKRSLNDINTYSDLYSINSNLSEAIHSLNIDTSKVWCDIPDAPNVPTPTPLL